MNLIKALATISGLTFLSRILGLVREIVIANLFGATMLTDAFNVAFRLPNLLRRLFAEGAFSQAFVPILSEYRNTRSPEETRNLVDHVASLLGLVVLVVSVLGVVGAPVVVWVTAHGFAAQPETFALTVSLTRITFPYIFFMAMVALAAGVLNTWSRFAIPAFTPVLLNICVIGAGLLVAPHLEHPIYALAWGTFLGGTLQLALQFPALRRIGMVPRFKLTLRDPGVNRILRLMAPATIGVSVSQISLLINTGIASHLKTGSVSWLQYADRVMEFPSGILGVAMGTILLPSLSKLNAQDRPAEFSSMLDWGLRLALMLTLPAALGIAMLGKPMIATLFHHGQFTAADVGQTYPALLAYSVGLAGIILVKILAPAFYSRQDIRTPLKIALISLVATQLMNGLFVFGIALPYPHAGLSLSIGLAATLNAGLLFWGLRAKNIFTPLPGWGLFLIKLAAALVVMGVVLWLTMGPDAFWLSSHRPQQIARLAGVISVGAAAYFAALFACGFRPGDFKRRTAE